MIQTGVNFGDIHSYTDLNLILSAVEVSPAAPKTNYVDIPGGDGSLDFTEAHGETKYKDRNINFTFSMNPSGGLSEAAWVAKQTQVSNAINGRVFNITLDKDPSYYWRGRVTVDSYKSNKRLRQFAVSAVVRPYKFKQSETIVTTDISETEKIIYLTNSRRSVCPFITCTDTTLLIFGGGTYNLGAGTHKVLNIFLHEGENEVKLSGSGTVTFKYQEADL